MKIGIITLPFHTNYGGLLQAYALQKTLQDMGHEVEFLERYKESYLLPIKVRYFVYLMRIIRKYLLGSKERVFLEHYKHKTDVVVRQHTNVFIKKYLNVRYIKNVEEIKETDYDAYVVGSDQIWRNSDRGERKDFFPFLDFTEGWHVKRIAYACSFGSEKWTYSPEVSAKISSLLKLFDYVSVREDSAVSFCKDKLGINAVHVLDPTMLICKDEYVKLVNIANTKPSKGSMLCYVLDESKQADDLIQKIASERNMVPFMVNSKVENIMENLTDRIQPPVEQWLRGFMDAEFVVTDSFHACVFSMIYNKPFICLGNKKRGMARFYSLLKMFNQEYRLFNHKEFDYAKTFEIPNISYNQQKEKSLFFIHNSLNICSIG